MTKHFTISLLVLLMSVNIGFANRFDEDYRFPGNSEAFLKELKTFMTASNDKELIEVFDGFEDAVKKGIYENPEMELIIKTSNSMLEHKLKASPYFGSYLRSVTNIKSNKCVFLRFVDWHETINEILNHTESRKFTPFKVFLEFSDNFFKENILYQTSSGQAWHAFTEDVVIKYGAEGPFVEFSEVDLVCLRKKNRIKIDECAGTFYPLENKWVGQGGTANWGRFGLGNVRCEFSTFELNVEKGIYSVPNATLYYDDFFGSQGVVGTFEDKVLVENNATEASYPRFQSNEKILKIKALGEGVSYQGGFKLQGTKVYGFGDKDQKAKVTVKGKGAADAFYASAELFIIHKGDKITGEEVATVLLVEGDSIYHPSVNMNFNIEDSKLLLTRGERGSNRYPFYSSFHNFNIDTEKIDWDIKSGELLFNEKAIKLGFSSSKVTFESQDYFNVQDYRLLQNVADVNPIATLKLLHKREGTTIIAGDVFAKAMNPNYDISSVERLLWDMVSKGYISYDKDTKEIEIRDKTFHYADAAMDKVDYDILKIVSDAEKTNAVFDLESKTILANGVNVVEFSNKQKVAAVPTENQILLKQNRNIDIDGNLYAGFGTFEGKDYHFDYEKFQIEMDSVRYFDLYVPTEVVSKDGQREAWSIASTIEHANGILLIDAPANKAGREDIPVFPSFQSKGNSYVYYDAIETMNGVYSRDSFYFKLDPFSFNHLDDFTEADLHFDGTMVSGYIFPDFKETIVLQEDDHSLGFTRDTPAEGFDLYQGKGHYDGKINVSNKGILGKGHVDYLWASIESEDITFKPEQMLTAAESFELVENRGAEVPKIKGADVTIDWRPYLDSMFIKAENEPFQLFENGQHTVFDLLILTPDGVKGRGEFKWDLGGMNSNLYSFGANSVQSDSADMSIRASGVDHLALKTDNVNAAFNFDKSTGHVKANVDSVTTILPYNKYRTSLNEYDWDIKNENITFISDPGQKGYFLSLDPGRDSLSFEGESAFYDLKTNELNVRGVDVIEAADAYVYPSDGNVDVRPGGQVATLENAKIVANTKNKYHVFERATVDVKGKKDYSATAYYQYPIAGKQQEVYFTVLGGRVGKGKKSEKEVMTRAQGAVTKEDNFFIDHKTRFEGKITLEAKEENLLFEGFAQLNSKSLANNNWFTINSKGDKTDLAISYDVPKDENGQPVRTGLFFNAETSQLYSSVMSALPYRKDVCFFEAKGLFKYDERRDIFSFGDSLKVVSGVKQGTLLQLDDATGDITMTGPISIGPSIDVMNVKSAGKITCSTDGSKETTMQVVSAIDMVVPEDLLNIIKADLHATSFDASYVVHKPYDVYEAALANLIPDSKVLASSIAELKANNNLFISPEYNKYSFLLSMLDLKWVPEYQSFVTKGRKIGLASILGTSYNKKLEGYAEFIKTSNGNDRFYLYFVSPGGDYYFFGYKDGILKTVSSSDSYNAAVEGLKKKDKFQKMDNGEQYEVQLTGPDTATQFINRVQAVQ